MAILLYLMFASAGLFSLYVIRASWIESRERVLSLIEAYVWEARLVPVPIVKTNDRISTAVHRCSY